MIKQFLRNVRRRINARRGLKLLAWTLFGGGLAILGHALVYRIRGEAVPESSTILLGALIGVGALVSWLFRLVGEKEAASEADSTFGLKDGLISACQFEEEGLEGEVYLLQKKRVEARVENLEAKKIPLEFPGRWATAGAGTLVIALWLGIQPPSLAVQERLEREKLSAERTEEIKEELEELIEELTKDLDSEELEILKPDQLKKWVAELKRTKDQHEALRQLARFEQKLAKAMAGLETKEDEEAMKLAAAELAKSDVAAARQLGKKLELKEFKLAAEDLKKAGKKGDQLKKEDQKGKRRKLTKEEMKKLREMTRRMADAKQRKNMRAGKDVNGKMVKPNGKDMQEMLADLDEAAAAMAEGMEELEMGEMEEGEFGMKEAEFDEKLGKLRGRLGKMNAKNKARKKMAGLRAGLGRAQSYAMGQSQGMGMSQAEGQGGLKAGVGSEKSRRDQRDELKNNDNYGELTGQKGEGPSITAVEDAESGTGVSGRSGESERSLDFQRRIESFVRRDDVPEDMKLGVKEYFERVHEVPEQKE